MLIKSFGSLGGSGGAGLTGGATTLTATVTSTTTSVAATVATTATTFAAAAEATSTAATSVTTIGTSGEHLLGCSLEPFGVLGQGGLDVLGSGPEIRGEELVGVADGVEASLDEVLGGTGHAGGSGVHIIDTSELQDLLGDGGGDNAGTTGSGGQLEADGTTLAGRLGGDGMNVSDLVTPVTSPHGDEGQLGSDKGALDGDLDLLGELDAETDVTGVITDDDDSLEAGPLSGLGLLLDGYDLHDLVGESSLGFLDELVNNGCLFDGDGVSVDLLKGGDVSVLDETAELGAGDPVVLAGTAEASTASTTATTATVVTAASTTTFATTVTTATTTTEGRGSRFTSCLGCLCFHLYFEVFNNYNSTVPTYLFTRFSLHRCTLQNRASIQN